ncbi:unnamed protein product [Rotaria sordida]|uniref:RING-type domain-containing protein n=1 Tax=Rotaria sordida TaxID=392033 RepID=A0A819EHZ8_9BILA|nr:unnamed protein product [Rotaria sordida]CAF1270406.1 unnamed protein product [Rotaria sordida]CAF3849845.1 unnamed protein product [Rotaria sordida]CAF3871928.1 unnamed protein product [Rotaria sordida]
MPSFEETLTCPICMDLFDDPRLLPCSHTFCYKCLYSIINNNHSFVICPICRSHFIGQILPINRIVLSLVEQIRQEKFNENCSININAKCYDCKSYQKLELCHHCDILLCNKCYNRHEIDWKNRNYRINNLLLSKVIWLKFQVNFKQHHEKISIFNERLHEIEYKLKNYRHPCNRQQYHENKHQIETITDDLHRIDMQLKEKIIENISVESSTCNTPLSAASSGYGSDRN